jgi:hypothetical protein
MMMRPHSAQVADRERKELDHVMALFSRQVINHVRPESGWKVLVIDSASLKVIDRSASFLSASRVPALLLDCSSFPGCYASFSSGAILATIHLFPVSLLEVAWVGICCQWNLQTAVADSCLWSRLARNMPMQISSVVAGCRTYSKQACTHPSNSPIT